MSLTQPRRDPIALATALLLLPIGAYFLFKHAIPRLEMTEAAYGEYYWLRRHWLLAHTVAGLLATVLGPLQFVSRLRATRPGLHRLTGKVYLSAVLVAAVCACVLALTSQISQSYQWGLLLGAALWIATGAAAYVAIRQRAVIRHRAWMIRNYTVTFFFITFFVAFDILTAAGAADVTVFAGPLVFGCLLLPLALVEAWLRSR
jgi:hypothetical protein